MGLQVGLELGLGLGLGLGIEKGQWSGATGYLEPLYCVNVKSEIFSLTL